MVIIEGDDSLFLSFCRVVNVVSSETSATKSQTPGNYPKRNKLQMIAYLFVMIASNLISLVAYFSYEVN